MLSDFMKRASAGDTIWMSDLRDAFAAAGLKLAEWPEHAAGLLPAADLTLHIALDGEAAGARRATLTARSPLGRRILRALREEEHA